MEPSFGNYTVSQTRPEAIALRRFYAQLSFLWMLQEPGSVHEATCKGLSSVLPPQNPTYRCVDSNVQPDQYRGARWLDSPERWQRHARYTVVLLSHHPYLHVDRHSSPYPRQRPTFAMAQRARAIQDAFCA